MSKLPLYSMLAFAGALPFLAFALLPIAGIESLGPLGPASQLLTLGVLLAIDYSLRKGGVITPQYFHSRCIATSLASASLLVAITLR